MAELQTSEHLFDLLVFCHASINKHEQAWASMNEHEWISPIMTQADASMNKAWSEHNKHIFSSSYSEYFIL